MQYVLLKLGVYWANIIGYIEQKLKYIFLEILVKNYWLNLWVYSTKTMIY